MEKYCCIQCGCEKEFFEHEGLWYMYCPGATPDRLVIIQNNTGYKTKEECVAKHFEGEALFKSLFGEE